MESKEIVNLRPEHVLVVINLASSISTPESVRAANPAVIGINGRPGYPEELVESLNDLGDRFKKQQIDLEIGPPGVQDFLCKKCTELTFQRTPCSRHGRGMYPDRTIMQNQNWRVGQIIQS
jgi:hypothetical protein